MSTEEIEITLQLEGMGWEDHWPRCRVSVNGEIYLDDEIRGLREIQFTGSVPEDSRDNVLCVDYYNRDYRTDVVLGPDGDIIKNKYVTINSIEFEEINLDQIPYLNSWIDVYEDWYTGQDSSNWPNPRFTEMQISWNGRWQMKFDSPVYIWLLENL